MHLFYLDESGQHGGNHFVLAGVAIFERQTYWISESLDKIQREVFPNAPEAVPFHASAIRAGVEDPWNGLTKQQRYAIIDRVYDSIVQSKSVLFAIAVERSSLTQGNEYEFAFESLLSRFDSFLGRLYTDTDERQKGLVILAESAFRNRLETVARQVRKVGTRWSELSDICEVPLFTPAYNSRLLQVADFCANAVWGRYERGQGLHFDKMVPKFDASEGTIHGLFHYTKNWEKCYCPACMSRRYIAAARAVQPVLTLLPH